MAIKSNGSGRKRVGNFAVENSDKLWKAAADSYFKVAAIVSATKTCENKGRLEACRQGSLRKVENSDVMNENRRVTWSWKNSIFELGRVRF